MCGIDIFKCTRDEERLQQTLKSLAKIDAQILKSQSDNFDEQMKILELLKTKIDLGS